ncbi:MAG: TraB/GumN family protein [Clostridia bacterium]|nr:TraB/GumN family protein [Clostridia bacterium]
MKRLIALMLCIIIFSSALTGCTDKITAPAAESVTAQTEAAVTEDSPATEEPSETEPPAVFDPRIIRLSDLERDEDGTPSDPFPYEETRAPFWCAVSENGGKLYLLGTIHIGDLRSASVLSRLDDTLAKCDVLVVELDMSSEDVLEEAGKTLTSDDYMTYADGTTIKDHIPEELFLKMKAFLERYGLYDVSMDRKNLYYWYEMIEDIFIYGNDAMKDGVYCIDYFLMEKANELGIPVEQMEGFAKQIDVVGNVYETFSEESIISGIEAMIDYTDEMFEAFSERYFDMMDAWYDRDEEYILDVVKIDKEADKVLVSERNVSMSEKAIEYIESGKTVFIAVGVAHMLGENGIVQSLRNAGYMVRRSRLVDPVY